MSFVRPGRNIHSATDDNGLSEKVLYSQAAPPTYKTYLTALGIMTCNPCLIANAEQLRTETYVTVYENKIERSHPTQCWCCGFDRVDVIYLDRDELSKVDKVSCCTPLCTHCRFFPTCCDTCGEGLILHGGDSCSPRQSCTLRSCNGLFFLCHCKMVYPVRDAEELKDVIVGARHRAVNRLTRMRSGRTDFTPHGHISLSNSGRADVIKRLQRDLAGSTGGSSTSRDSRRHRTEREADDEVEVSSSESSSSSSDSESDASETSSAPSRDANRRGGRGGNGGGGNGGSANEKAPNNYIAVAQPANNYGYPPYPERMER